MLIDGEIVKKNDVSADDKYEITNISNYMHEMGYLDDMDWFPNNMPIITTAISETFTDSTNIMTEELRDMKKYIM